MCDLCVKMAGSRRQHEWGRINLIAESVHTLRRGAAGCEMAVTLAARNRVRWIPPPCRPEILLCSAIRAGAYDRVGHFSCSQTSDEGKHTREREQRHQDEVSYGDKNTCGGGAPKKPKSFSCA